MEYHSPLGHTFKLQESLAKQEQRRNELNRRSSSNNASFESDGFTRRPFPFENTQKRNSYYDRSPGFGEQRGKWNSPHEKDRRGNSSSVSISDYYHPSMVEDPWKELEEKMAAN